MNKNKKRSNVWNFFDERELNKAKCKFCSKILSYKGNATGNLIRHLKLVHPSVKVKDEDVLSASQDNINLTGACSSNTDAESKIEESTSVLKPKDSNHQSSVLTSFIKRPLSDRKTQELHNSLVKVPVKNYLPIQLVDSPYFRSFVNNLNNNYQVPSRKTVSNTLIPQIYNMTQERIKNTLDSVVACCLTTDGWTSCVNTSYISVTAHYITKDNTLESSLLDCYEYSERHTAENLSNELLRMVRKWNIPNKIVAVASDNAANISAAIRLTEWKHIPGFAHSLNLIVQSSLKIITVTQSKIKKIVEHFKRSTQASTELKEMQVQLNKPVLKLKQDCVTRWNSTFDMFNRILEVKESLMSVIAIHYTDLLNIDNNDILIIQGVCALLRVFKDVTEEMSSEQQVTATKVILLSNSLQRHCSDYLQRSSNAPTEVKDFGKKLLENLNQRFHLIEHNKIYAEATLLDPRFKRHGFNSESTFEKAKQSLIAQVTALSVTQNIETANPTLGTKDDVEKAEQSIWASFDKKVSNTVKVNNPKAAAIIEVDKYLGEPLQPRKDNPLQWWNQRSHVYPHLSELVKKKFCIVATSVPSERIFSKAGRILTDQRNRLSGKRVSQILFVNANL